MLYKHIAPLYKDLVRHIEKDIKEQIKNYQTTAYDQISDYDIIKSLTKNKKTCNKFNFLIIDGNILKNNSLRNFNKILTCDFFSKTHNITLGINYNNMDLEYIIIKSKEKESFEYMITKNESIITSFNENEPFGISTFYEDENGVFELTSKYKDILLSFKKPKYNILKYNKENESIEFKYDFLDKEEKEIINIILDQAYKIEANKYIIFVDDLKPSFNKGLDYIKNFVKASF